MRILILGGSTEASLLAAALAGDRRFSPVLSLAGRTRNPRTPPIAYRIGGFGGVAGLAAYLRANAIQALVDATHPFAARISANAVAAAAEVGVPLLAVSRAAWVPGDGDRWTTVGDFQEAAEALGPLPRRVLLTLGRLELAPFRAACWHSYVVRSVDAPCAGLLPPDCTVITARGPFQEEDEKRLLLEQRIDIIATKNSGGSATSAKLAAARTLGIPVLMVRRPPPSGADTSGSVQGVLRWLDARHKAAAPLPRGV